MNRWLILLAQTGCHSIFIGLRQTDCLAPTHQDDNGTSLEHFGKLLNSRLLSHEGDHHDYRTVHGAII